MGVLFVAGMTTYAAGVAALGPFGGIVVWGNSMAVTIMASSLWDLANKEWHGRPVRVMVTGVGALLAAIVLLAFAQYFYQIESAPVPSAMLAFPGTLFGSCCLS